MNYYFINIVRLLLTGIIPVIFVAWSTSSVGKELCVEVSVLDQIQCMRNEVSNLKVNASRVLDEPVSLKISTWYRSNVDGIGVIHAGTSAVFGGLWKRDSPGDSGVEDRVFTNSGQYALGYGSSVLIISKDKYFIACKAGGEGTIGLKFYPFITLGTIANIKETGNQADCTNYLKQQIPKPFKFDN